LTIPPNPKKSTKTTRKSTGGSQAAALERTIDALREAGRLADVDEARIQIARGLAAATDAQPDNPTVWREYRAAERDLRKETEHNADPFDQLLTSIAAEIRHEKKPKAEKPRG
jgi:thioesterase domain-containing protein